MQRLFRILLLITLLGLAAQTSHARAPFNAWTYHYDNLRTGANTNESILTPSNVNTNSFGKLFSCAVDGYMYAQPLYVANVAIVSNGVHNVVFAATEHNSVYAFDADSNAGPNSTALWHRSLMNAGETPVGTNEVQTTDITPQIGISGTPVIDVNAGTLYVVAKSKLVSGGVTNYYQRLYALDITSGQDRSNSPALIQASVPGTGAGNDGAGNVPFDPLREAQRSGLLLLNGAVYIAWGAHGDIPPYHGWVMGYDAQTLQQLSVFNTTPNGSDGGIWQAGGAPAADTNGNIYFVTGNGTFGTNNYGDTMLKLSTAGNTLTVVDYFTPYNQLNLSTNDSDLGSSQGILLPDAAGGTNHPLVMIGTGKRGTLYVVDCTNMGGFNSANDNQIVQYITNAVGVCLDNVVYFNNRLYHWTYNDFQKIFSVSNSQVSLTPILQGSVKAGFPGSPCSISANGTNNAICWNIDASTYKTSGPSVLHAFNAYTLAELYNSTQAGARDTLGGSVKFTVATVANGKVFVGTETSLAVFGNAAFTAAPIIIQQPQSQTVNAGVNATFTAGAAGTNAFSVQWYFNSARIPGATQTNFTVLAAQITNAGNYSVVLSNLSGTTPSANALLTVIAPLTNNPGAILAPPGLVNWWPADGNALDIFSGNNGTPSGAFTYTVGESGMAFSFDGNTAYLTVGAANIPAPWTACMWVNRQPSLTNASILLGDNTYYLKLEQYNGTHEVGITQLGVADYIFSPTYIAPANAWVHLTFLGTTSNTVLYVNGVQQGTISTSFPLPRSYIGTGFVSSSSKFINFLRGGLDEILLFNRALAPSEIIAIYSAGSAGLWRAPQFTSLSDTNGQFNLTLQGQTGKTFTLYTSTNLTNWQLLTTLPNPAGATNFIDVAPTNAQKFYRATQP
jgi:hypothetical protein